MEVNPTKTIELIGYTAVVNGQPALSPTVDLGTENSYGVEYLQLKFGEGWGDLTITATFTAPDKTSTDAVVDINGLVEVPHEATCHGSGRGVIVFKGCRNGVQLISCDVGSFVTAHGPVNGSESAEPTPDKWQQFVDEVQDDREAANKAAQDAAASADRAEAAAENAENAAQTAADAAGFAGQAANAANESAKAAQTAQGSAESAAQSAVGSARAAADSAAAAKKSAENAAASSKSAAGKAEESASSASAATENAKAAQTAQGSAENAAQTAADAAGVAGQAAGEAAQRAAAAETAKQGAEDAAQKALEAKTGSENALRDADAAKDAASGYADAAEEKATAASASEKNAAKSANSAADSAAAAKKSAEDADNTANSIKDSMAQISENKEAVSQLKEDTAALKKRQNVLVGSETGNPVSCNDAFAAPLCGLTVYGKSTQDGTPTPDAPVPIVSAGDGGSVAVKVTGKNLYHAAWTGNYSESGLLLTATSTTIAIKGTATKDVLITRWLVQKENPIPLDPNKRYTLTQEIMANGFKGVRTFTYDEEGVGTYAGSSIPARSTGASFYYQKEFKKDEAIDFETSIQVEIGTEATEYEPYHEQLLALPTPNGLPGIPVTSGGNYTDPQGQQWVCDEVDFERGVKVQRVGKCQVNTNDGIADEQYRLRVSFLGDKGKSGDDPCIISITHYVSWTSCVFQNLLYLKNITKPEGGFYTGEELKTSAIDVDFVYQFATPIETPLTPAEIAAYKALTAYAPDTVVQAIDGAGIKLDYQRDVNLVVKNLEDAIASMTTT